MTFSDLIAKYSMTQSIARPLCDSRATCIDSTLQRIPPPTPRVPDPWKFNYAWLRQTKVTRKSNPDFRIDPGPGVRRIVRIRLQNVGLLDLFLVGVRVS